MKFLIPERLLALPRSGEVGFLPKLIDGELGKPYVGVRLDIWPHWGEGDRDEESLSGR